MTDFEPDLKYCPRCDDEYMPVAENCAACEIGLISGQERIAMEEARRNRLAGRSSQLSETDDLVNIHRGSLAEMKHLAALLAAERIGTLVAGDDSSCGKGCCSVFFLQTRREEAQDALEILAHDFRKKTGLDHHDTSHADAVFDPSAELAVCPACGHGFSPADTTCPDCGLCLG